MAAKQNSSILGEAKPSQAIVKLALPATLALLAKAVYNIVDTAYIGMLDSDIALARPSAATSCWKQFGVTPITVIPVLLIRTSNASDRN